MFLFVFELMISKSPSHRRLNRFVEVFMIIPDNGGGPMLSTENGYLSNHPPLMHILIRFRVLPFPARGCMFLVHISMHLYNYFCRAEPHSSESKGRIHIKNFGRYCQVILQKGGTMSHSYQQCVSVSPFTLDLIHLTGRK